MSNKRRGKQSKYDSGSITLREMQSVIKLALLFEETESAMRMFFDIAVNDVENSEDVTDFLNDVTEFVEAFKVELSDSYASEFRVVYDEFANAIDTADLLTLKVAKEVRRRNPRLLRKSELKTITRLIERLPCIQLGCLNSMSSRMRFDISR